VHHLTAILIITIGSASIIVIAGGVTGQSVITLTVSTTCAVTATQSFTVSGELLVPCLPVWFSTDDVI
jgi:hypothetical protein